MDGQKKNMARELDGETFYKLSLIRRLTDSDPANREEGSLNGVTAEQLREDVFENIGMLFNSRSHGGEADFKNYEEIKDSVLVYGISDYCGKKYSDEELAAFAKDIERQVKYFESRIDPATLKVEVVSGAALAKTSLELRISGVIRVGGAAGEMAHFVSKLDLETGRAELSLK